MFEKYFKVARETFENHMIDISEAISVQIGETKNSIEKNLKEISENHLNSLVELNFWILAALIVILALFIFAIFKKNRRKVATSNATFTHQENNQCSCRISV